VVTVVGCTPASPGPGAPPAAAGGRPTSTVTEVRRSALPVPAGYRVLTVEFADATHGYAGMATRDPVAPDRYGSAVFATVDSRRTWRQLEDPRRPSPSPQLYTVDARTIVLLAEPGWFVSTDGGASFQPRPDSPAPPELAGLSGDFGLDCTAGCSVARRGGPVNQPGLPGVLSSATEVGTGGPVWAVSMHDGAPRSAVSEDHGATWRPVDVPAQAGGQPDRMTVIAGGSDVWLVGYLGGDSGSLGRAIPLRRKNIGMPLLWRLVADRWLPQGTVDAPRPGQDVYSVASIGGGLAAVAGPPGLFLVDAAWHQVDLFPRAEWVTTLRDGTIFAAGPTNQTYYLGIRTGSAVNWIQVVVSASEAR
jgi:hypothetical protein